MEVIIWLGLGLGLGSGFGFWLGRVSSPTTRDQRLLDAYGVYYVQLPRLHRDDYEFTWKPTPLTQMTIHSQLEYPERLEVECTWDFVAGSFRDIKIEKLG